MLKFFVPTLLSSRNSCICLRSIVFCCIILGFLFSQIIVTGQCFINGVCVVDSYIKGFRVFTEPPVMLWEKRHRDGLKGYCQYFFIEFKYFQLGSHHQFKTTDEDRISILENRQHFINSCVVFWQFFATRVFLDDNSERRHASKKLFPRTPPEISSRNFWCNKNFQKKKFHRRSHRMYTGNLSVPIWLSNL